MQKTLHSRVIPSWNFTRLFLCQNGGETTMTNEKLNTALYEKMFAEQETYRAWLLSQPSEEILNHTYEYTCREDILLSLEYHNLTDAQASIAVWGQTADLSGGFSPAGSVSAFAP